MGERDGYYFFKTIIYGIIIYHNLNFFNDNFGQKSKLNFLGNLGKLALELTVIYEICIPQT